MHPALRKGPLFYNNTPISTFLKQKTSQFRTFFTKNTPQISYPAYGPELAQSLTIVRYTDPLTHSLAPWAGHFQR